jgi:hypothetical protein
LQKSKLTVQEKYKEKTWVGNNFDKASGKIIQIHGVDMQILKSFKDWKMKGT